MTIETTTPGGDPLLKSGPYNGDGVVTVFDYDFQIQREEELRVTVLLSGEGTGSELTLTTDYTVSGVGNDDGGQITLASATLAPSGSKLVIEYDGGFNQSIEWSNQGRVQLSILESAFDKVTMHLRLIKDLADRSVKVDQFEETSPDDILDTLFTARDTAVSSAADAVVTLGKTEDVLAAFEEAYLGAFASDPGTDNEGGALKEGALYYNTVGLEVRSYDGTGWASLATADATLTSIAALGTAADKGLYTTGVDTWAEMTVTAAGRALLDDVDAAAQRGTLGLGGLATLNILDEDDFISNSATRPPSQQSTKAYVDTNTVGVEQTWQDVSASRVASTSYQNTTGRPIMISVKPSSLGAGKDLEVSADNSAWVAVGKSGDVELIQQYAIVPGGHYYRFTGDFTLWAELR